jgi:hypothetical protein
LAIGPKTGDSAQILQEQAQTLVVDFDEKPTWTAIQELTSGKIDRSSTLSKYSRQELAKVMSSFLNELTLESSK